MGCVPSVIFISLNPQSADAFVNWDTRIGSALVGRARYLFPSLFVTGRPENVARAPENSSIRLRQYPIVAVRSELYHDQNTHLLRRSPQ